MDALVTGGAGFIGSHVVRAVVESGRKVRVLDDLSTGAAGNLDGVDAEIVLGDVRDPASVRDAAAGVDVVYHLAALPSVARSVADPATSHAVNATGTLNVLLAARDAGVRRLVYASSSSVYGDTAVLPKHEDLPPAPRSPYASSKLAGEAACRAFTSAFGLETVSLRLFNVFGPGQDPASEYAAVIPRTVTRMLAGAPPVVFGDGRQSRDFTYVENVVRAFILAAGAGPEAAGQVANVGCGARASVLDLVDTLNELMGTDLSPVFADPRPGDVRDSQAAIERAEALIGYRPVVGLREGLARTVEWFATRGTAPAADPAGTR